MATTQLLHAHGVPVSQLCKILTEYQARLEAAENYKGAREVEEHLHAIRRQEAVRQMYALQAKQLKEVEELEEKHRQAVVILQQQWDRRLQSMACQHETDCKIRLAAQLREIRIFEQVPTEPFLPSAAKAMASE
jgi:hypothetical protein